MRISVTTIALLMSCIVYGQPNIEEKVAKMLGDGYEHFDPGYLPNTHDSTVATPIPSRTVEDIIIGYEWNGEFIAQPDTSSRIEILYPMLMGHEFVSKAEFLEFQHWVRDSIAREKIYFGSMGPAGHMYSEDAFEEDLEYKEFTQDSTEAAHRYLDWSKKLRYTDAEVVPLVADMYLPIFERFRGVKAFDDRKFIYYFNRAGVGAFWPIKVDHYNWALNSEHPFGRYYALSYLDDQLFLDDPISNIESFMAEAYCHWKSEQLSKKVSKYGVRVECRLPTLAQARYARGDNDPRITFPEHDFTKEWHITNKDFREFSQAVFDSIRREILYYELEEPEDAAKLLDYTDVYFDESSLDYREFDPADRSSNRDIFFFDRKRKVKWNKSPYKEVLERSSLREMDQLYYTYQWFDAQSRAIKGKLTVSENYDALTGLHYLETTEVDSLGDPIGEDLNLDVNYGAFLGYGTRDHTDLSRFIHTEKTAIPMPEDIPEDNESADISYEQALAYYNWKYRIDSYSGDENGDWWQFIFPTEKEFQTVQNGVHLKFREREVPFESPVFRMVVEIIPHNKTGR